MRFIKSNLISFILIALSFCLIAFGMYNKEAEQVYRKAVNICMECIGLG